MDELYAALEAVIHSIETVTELFYTQKETEGYDQLNKTIDGISKSMELLLEDFEGEQVPDSYLEIINYLQEAFSAIEARDTILLADILQYEIKERFEKIWYEIR
jgi:hypothetical protein